MSGIITTTLNKIFSRSARADQAEEARPICSTNYVAFQKTFQTFNKYLYQTENLQNGQTPLISKIYTGYKTLVGDHFKDLTKINPTYSIFTHRQHAFISYLEYLRTTPENESEEWASFMICSSTQKGGGTALSPHLFITGKIQYINNEYSIIPMNAEYLKIKGDSGYLVQVKEREHFRQLMGYANQAFLQGMTNNHLNPEENCKWMEIDYKEKAKTLFDTFPDRTLYTLEEEGQKFIKSLHNQDPIPQ